jgi:hypothetical protein
VVLFPSWIHFGVGFSQRAHQRQPCAKSGQKSAPRIRPQEKVLSKNCEPFRGVRRLTRVTHLLLSLQDNFQRDVGAYMLISRSSFKGQEAEQEQNSVAATYSFSNQHLRL